MANIPAWAQVGYEAVEQRDKELQEAQERARNFIPTFTLKPDEEAQIRFLTVEPVNFWEHFLKNAQGRKNFTCMEGLNGQTCPLCAAGNKPSYTGAYIVIDQRYEEFTRSNGEKVQQQNTVKIFKQGIRALKMIKKNHEKRGLQNWDWEISRTGSGTDTQYSMIPVEKADIALSAEILNTDWRERLFQELAPWSAEDLVRVLRGERVAKGASANGAAPATGSNAPSTDEPPFDMDLDPDDGIVTL